MAKHRLSPFFIPPSPSPEAHNYLWCLDGIALGNDARHNGPHMAKVRLLGLRIQAI